MQPSNVNGADEPPSLEASTSTAVEEAIKTDLAPAVALAMLDKADHPEDPGSPAMRCISAGVSAPADGELVRIQFMFENGTVLPIDVPRTSCEALARGLLREIGLS